MTDHGTNNVLTPPPLRGAPRNEPLARGGASLRFALPPRGSPLPRPWGDRRLFNTKKKPERRCRLIE
jgi:hypothetical protein